MKLSAQTGLIVLGIVIGLAAGGRWSRISAQSTSRLVEAGATSWVGSARVTLVKDSRSASCWLMAEDERGVALAPAPPETCK